MKNYFYSQQEKLFTLLSCLDQVDCWKKDQITLLAVDDPSMYIRNLAIPFFAVVQKSEGQIIGEQALLSNAPRNATLFAATDVSLLTIDKETFEEYCSNSFSKHEERVQFFTSCFPTISKKVINNFHCMFHEEVFSRGDIITLQKEQKELIYIIEEGEVGIVNQEKTPNVKKCMLSQLELVSQMLTIGINCWKVFLHR